jgi:hypothetical protein
MKCARNDSKSTIYIIISEYISISMENHNLWIYQCLYGKLFRDLSWNDKVIGPPVEFFHKSKKT